MNKTRFGIALLIFAVMSSVALSVQWFGEGNAPRQSDTPGRSLQKINDLLLIASTQAVANISVSNLAINVGGVSVTNDPTVGLDVHATNITGTVTATVSPNPLPVVVTNTAPVPVTVTNGSIAVNITNASLTVAGTVTATVSPNPLPVVVTNSLPVPVTVTNTSLKIYGTGATDVQTLLTSIAGAYAAGDSWVTNYVTMTNAVPETSGSAIFQGFTLQSNDDTSPALIMLLCNKAPIWTFDANAVGNVTANTLSNVVWHTNITSGHYLDLGTNRIATVDGANAPVANGSAARNLYWVIIANDTTVVTNQPRLVTRFAW